ncbi:hypothetical protein BH10PSE4_BH10PSE4_16460 [soil metagenome]
MSNPKNTLGANNLAATGTSLQPSSADPRGKLGQIVALLRRPLGASLAEMMEATGWQAHSIRGAISGALKKKLGLLVSSAKAEGSERRYRIEDGTAHDAA